MGFFSGLKGVGGTIFNFRVGKWLGYDQIKGNTQNLTSTFKSTFTPEQAEQTETFEEALKRLNLTQADIEQRKKEFTNLLTVFLISAAALFGYSIYIVVVNGNIWGFFMCLAITLYALSQAFKYHFWLYQINNKKLGCSIKDWFNDKK